MSNGFQNFKNGINLEPLSADPSSPAEGDLQFADGTARAAGLWQYKSGAWTAIGGGSGGINYLSGDNSDAENGAGDWATYADAAGVNPVDGTGGSATITFAQNATTPLRDDADFKLVKDAADRQGEGAGCAFTIDKADQAQKLTISFDYDTSDSDYADDDIRIAIYDVSNTNLIRVVGEDLKGGKGTHYAQFQSAVDSTSYRLIFHQSTTNAAAYDLYFDNIQVGPASPSGANQDIIAEGAGNGGTSITANVTNVDFIETRDTTASFDGTTFTAPVSGDYDITGSILQGSANTNSQAKAYVDAVYVKSLGRNVGSDTVLPFSGSIYLDKGEALTLRINETVSLSNTTTEHWIHIKKAGISEEANAVNSGRDVVVKGYLSGVQAVSTSSEATIEFDLTDIDTTGTFDTGNYWYKIPESGYYFISLQVRMSSHADEAYTLKIKETTLGTLQRANMSANDPGCMITSGVFYLDKDAQVFGTVDSTADSAYNLTAVDKVTNISIHKIQSGAATLETQTVAARYSSNSGQAVTGATNIVYEDLEEDTHNAYNSSTGVYTIPVSGWYYVAASARLGVGSATFTLYAQVNSTQFIKDSPRDAVAQTLVSQLNTVKYFNKGDTIEVQPSGTRTLSTVSEENVFSIARIK